MIKKHILNLEYPEYADEKKQGMIDLSLGDNPLKSEKAVETINDSDINGYILTQNKDLIKKLSILNKVEEGNIAICAGADSALGHIADLFICDKDKVIIPSPTFNRYEFHTRRNNAKPIFLKFSEFPFSFEIEKIIKKAKKNNPKIIFLCNPNNPTGNYLRFDDLKKLAEELKNTIIVIDEALIDYIEEIKNEADERAKLTKDNMKVIFVRSFSKRYGLAGLRIGYIIAHEEIIRELLKLISPFEVNSLAIKAAAAVLDDEMHKKKSKENINHSKKILAQQNIQFTNTSSLFCMIKVEKGINLHKFLYNKGINTINCRYFRGIEKSNTVRVNLSEPEKIMNLINIMKKAHQTL